MVFWSFLLGTLLLAGGGFLKMNNLPPANILMAAGGALQSMAIILFIAGKSRRAGTGNRRA